MKALDFRLIAGEVLAARSGLMCQWRWCLGAAFALAPGGTNPS
ncbi:hypothetical protein ACPOL_6933 (plasmid) [Acidisarcina polymorpha]|uniref:Uncharacterized protein n=1 Tax=Acidisarcina polymorpha TaxID=2211140 RepID=A0A2Z5GBY7_9BACT|nr:hypothetical protein ACPOL_6907 [Acidisarcina polymorpha]AXC16137.1 hypothetical protein ACPOL_6933 [Acidisarcina polymorpha]